MKSTPEMRRIRIAMLRDMIDTHLERADDLEHFGNHWWRVSKYAWLHAAFIHRNAARQLTSVLEGIERGIWDA